jgi:hypothetical protein
MVATQPFVIDITDNGGATEQNLSSRWSSIRCANLIKRGTIMRKLALSVVVAVAAMAIPSAASAKGPPDVVLTETAVVSATVPFGTPCGGGGMVTVEFHDVFHVTEFADGSVHVSTNQNGTFAFVPDPVSNPDGLSSSGHYRTGGSFSSTQNSITDTSVFNIVGRDENGDQVKVQIRSHFTIANGEVRVDNFELTCG